MKKIILTLTLICALALTACGVSQKVQGDTMQSTAPLAQESSQAERWLAEMTLEEKVGQLFVIRQTWEALKACELIPFIEALGETDLVMVAHITTPNVTNDGLPATMSQALLEGKLRGELGYQGVIITDSMAMGAITEAYTSAESAVEAIKAGVDILLMPQDFVEAYEGVLSAVKDKMISEERLDESMLRILQLKMKIQ